MRQLRLGTNRIVSDLGSRFNRGISNPSGDSLVLVSDSDAIFVNLDSGCRDDIPLACPSSIVEFSFLLDGSVWFAHQSGVLSKYITEDSELETLGESEEGISAAKWSPDGELLILVSQQLLREDSLQILSAELDLIQEQAAVAESVGEDVQVNVGWGSRDTQFMGSAGKSEREKEIRKVFQLSEFDNCRGKILLESSNI